MAEQMREARKRVPRRNNEKGNNKADREPQGNTARHLTREGSFQVQPICSLHGISLCRKCLSDPEHKTCNNCGC